MADVYRGRSTSIRENDGNIAVINIKDIKENGIDYSDLDLINLEERKVSPYILRDDDVLVSIRGTNIKVGVFHSQNKTCIASVNLCVIRTSEKKFLKGDYLRLFFLSKVGMKLLKRLQRGTTIVNINTKDIELIEVPIPSINDQEVLVEKYNNGLSFYQKTVKAAQETWNNIQDDILNNLY